MSDLALWVCPKCNAGTRGRRYNRAACGHCGSPRPEGVVPAGEEQASPTRTMFLPKPSHLRAFGRQAEWHKLVDEARQLMVKDIREEGAKRKLPTPKVRASAKHLLEIAPVDLHLGKLAWGEETGQDYDIRIAERVFCDAIDDTLLKAQPYPLEGIVLIVGNDLLQSDNQESETTAGTYVDTDSRYVKAFRRARAVNSWAIRECAKVAPVTVIVVPGNHDSLTAFHIGEVLQAEFDSVKHVTVDNSPKRRKYLRYGVNLIGWTHGNMEKHADLPLIMAQECPEGWSQTKHREWHTGHYHKSKEMRFTAGDAFNGVRVRVLPSLCSPDAWHYAMGYVHERRACESYLWNRDTGYAGHFSSNVAEAA